jgi:hypothetical protein
MEYFRIQVNKASFIFTNFGLFFYGINYGFYLLTCTLINYSIFFNKIFL